MNSNPNIRLVLLILLPLLLQVTVFKHFNLFNQAFVFIYPASVLLLPLRFANVLSLMVGFSVGLTVDIFHDTAGIHAAASTFLAFLRPGMLRLLTPPGGYENNTDISIKQLGIVWFAPYIFILVFADAFAFFALDFFSFKYFLRILSYSFFSALLSTFVIYLLQMLVEPTNRR